MTQLPLQMKIFLHPIFTQKPFSFVTSTFILVNELDKHEFRFLIRIGRFLSLAKQVVLEG